MNKPIAVIIALALFAMLVATMFALYEAFGDAGMIVSIILFLTVLSFFVTSKPINKWLEK